MTNNPWENNSNNIDPIKFIKKFFSNFNKENNKNPKVMPILIGICLLWGASGFYTVKPDEQGVVLRLGKWVRSTGPGLHYRAPAPIESVIIQPVTTISRIDVGGARISDEYGDVDQSEHLMLTGDSNLANVTFNVLWKIKHDGVEEFLFNARSPELAIKACAESEMRSVIGKNKIEYAQTEGRAEIASEVKEQLQKILDKYNTGVEIVQINLQNVEPPAPVIDSFRDVERAQADQQRFVNDADAYRRNLIANTKGEVAKIVNDAEARKQALIAEATGMASKFSLVYEQYKSAKDITKKRIYLDTIKDVIKSSNVTILDENNGILPHTKL